MTETLILHSNLAYIDIFCVKKTHISLIYDYLFEFTDIPRPTVPTTTTTSTTTTTTPMTTVTVPNIFRKCKFQLKSESINWISI